jgi:hypothetical protein
MQRAGIRSGGNDPSRLADLRNLFQLSAQAEKPLPIAGDVGYNPGMSGRFVRSSFARGTHAPRRAYRFTIRPLPEDEGGGYLIEFPDLPGCRSDEATIGKQSPTTAIAARMHSAPCALLGVTARPAHERVHQISEPS